MGAILKKRRLPACVLAVLVLVGVLIAVRNKHGSWHELHSFQVWSGNGFSVFPVVFSPDGTQVAALNFSDNPVIWSTANGAERRVFQSGLNTSADSLAFSSDGTTLASAGDSGDVLLWDVTTGELIRCFRISFDRVKTTRYPWGTARTYPCSSVIISENAARVAASYPSEGKIRVWSIAKGEEEFAFPAPEDLAPVAFSPGGQLLAVAKPSGELAVIDLSRAASPQLIGRQGTYVRGAVFSPDEKVLATAGGTIVKVWDLQQRKELRTLDGHYDAVDALAFSPNGGVLASSCGAPAQYRWWSVLTGRSLWFEEDPGQLRLWDPATGQELHRITTARSADSIAFSPDEKRLAAGSWDGTIIVWDLPDRAHIP